MISDNKTEKILIIDDNRTTRESLAFMLRGQNYQIDLAGSAADAVVALENNLPDVILMDVVMPEVDGYELCSQIKQNPDWEHVPVILVTRLASQDALVKGLEVGADEFLTKPVSSLELRARVRSMLRIKRNYDSLKESAKLREDLAHMMAHDMRNPIAVVQMNAFLMGKKCDNPELERHVTTIRKQTQSLDQLIQQTLLLARTSSNELVLNRMQVDLNQFCRDLEQATQPVAELAGITLESHLLPETTTVLIDGELLRRAIDNVLANAIKFAPAGTTVQLMLTLFDEGTEYQVSIQIRDQGPGIPVEDRERIFDQYEVGRLRREGVQQTGLGLGLAFSRRIVEAHNGRIYVTDNQPQGSIFVIEI